MPFWRGAFFVGWGTQFIQAGAEGGGGGKFFCHMFGRCHNGVWGWFFVGEPQYYLEVWYRATEDVWLYLCVYQGTE